MEILGYIFGIFGLMAYLQIPELKRSIENLERELTRTQGTSYHIDRKALIQAVGSYIGKKVNIYLKEDHEDADIMNYGNTKHGSVTILDTDDEWILIRVDSKKKTVTKLIRLESVEGISVLAEE